MARKKASEMTPQERLDALQRQQDKLVLEMKGINAEKACQMLVDAYAQGERNGGSVDWSALDEAHAVAMQVCKPSV